MDRAGGGGGPLEGPNPESGKALLLLAGLRALPPGLGPGPMAAGVPLGAYLEASRPGLYLEVLGWEEEGGEFS
ncbi:hypothetical protein [Thermus scotoductus]|uniref:hypothetical protein n=1 Tax=Thermus scotoductus TaxID=37636 RepID=UPI0012E0277D|nr:hypothetical protein [Thermus scotoductus]